jgi:hypothetical protein
MDVLDEKKRKSKFVDDGEYGDFESAIVPQRMLKAKSKLVSITTCIILLFGWLVYFMYYLFIYLFIYFI